MADDTFATDGVRLPVKIKRSVAENLFRTAYMLLLNFLVFGSVISLIDEVSGPRTGVADAVFSFQVIYGAQYLVLVVGDVVGDCFMPS